MAKPSPPVYTNSPLAVIPTPQFQTGKVGYFQRAREIVKYCSDKVLQTDPFTVEASHMALSHNAFIRGFNSIYQQAPRVPDTDKLDFAGYCIAWHDCVNQHHHYEETEFFPNLDKAAGKKGLMSTAFEEHGALCTPPAPE